MAAISVDADPLSSYYKSRGWEPASDANLNACYDEGLMEFHELFKKLGVKSTIFVTGEELEKKNNINIVSKISEQGHEIGCHTYSHPLGFYKMYPEDMEKEITKTAALIKAATGAYPSGFRSPGWNISGQLQDVLEKLNYKYDSSVIPGPFQPFFTLGSSIYNKGKRINNFTGQSILSPTSPYATMDGNLTKKGDSNLMELPCCATPGPRLPFYGTAVFALGKHYFDFALSTIPTSANYVSFVFHAIELVDFSESIKDERMKVKPGAALRKKDKIEFISYILSGLSSKFELTSLFETYRHFERPPETEREQNK